MIDFQAIAAAALQSLPSLLAEWFPNGHREGNELKVGSPAGEPGRSLSINLRSGVWKDFSSGDGGSDPISLLAAIRSCSMTDAAREIDARLQTNLAPPEWQPAATKQDWLPIVPVPDGVPSPVFRHKRHGMPSASWTYRTADCGTIGFIHRFDLADGHKEILPQTYCQAGDRREWRFQSFPKPRPLYGLDLLAANTDAGVIVVEGEKAADAARTICPGVVVTWPGGSKAVRYVDWTPLAGRKVLIWPDADAPGHDAARAICGALAGIADKVRIIHPPAGVAEGWDLADAVAEGWDREKLLAWLKPPATPTQDAPEPPPGYDCPEDTAIPVEAATAQPQRKWKDDRIGDLPFRLLGVDGDSFFYMPDSGQQIVGLSASAHSKNNLMRLAPLQIWEAEYPTKQGADWDAATNALIQRSQGLPKFDPRRIRGRGCWIDGADVVFHAGDKLVVNGREVDIPVFQSAVRAIYEGALEIPVDSAEVATNAQAARLIELCELLSWEQPLYGKLLAGWIALAPICGALGWRPHLWVTGPSGSGKSWTVANIIHPMVGRTALHVQGNTSEAGIRGHLGSDALPVVFDEAESEDRASQIRFNGVLELARQASTETGAGIVKGTASGGSITYMIRSMFLFASIGVAAVKKADTSRVTVLPLRKNTGPYAQEDFDRIKSLWRDTVGLEGYCERIRSRSLRNAKVINTNTETFSSVAVEFTGDKRSADQIGTLLAGAYSLTSGKEISKQAARSWMAQQEWSGFRSEDVDNDENQCLAHLFAAPIRFEIQGHGATMSVSEIIAEIHEMPEYTPVEAENFRRDEFRKTLLRHGMKLEGRALFVANRHQLLEKIFADTAWAGAKWKLQLERVKGAKRVETMAFGSHVRQRAVEIPV
jgi:putative DNA primase/helicase